MNGAVQSFNGSNRLFADPDLVGSVRPDCPPSFLAVTAGSDPVNIGVVIVIVFFIILIIAILGSFFAFKGRPKSVRFAWEGGWGLSKFWDCLTLLGGGGGVNLYVM